MGLKSLVNRLTTRPASPSADIPAPGLYHYVWTTAGGILPGGEWRRLLSTDEMHAGHSRIHLRLDADGSGVLLVNASRVMHLNPTAALMAYLALENRTPESAVQVLRRVYRVSPAQARDDYAQIATTIQQLVLPDGACPVHQLELEIEPPFSARPSAPYRMDLALTYRCNNDCPHCYNARPRSFPEMDTARWKRVIDRVWDQGIPHLVFTGGEPTLHSDLPELIAYAEGLGLITGLNTNGRRLSDPAFLDRLVQAGLDHVQITVESHDPAIHDLMVGRRGAWKQTIAGLKNALSARLFVMTNTTMLRHNSPFLAQTLDFLGELGVPTIGLNALIYAGHGRSVGTGLSERELHPLLEIAREKTAAYNQRLIWYTPTQYCNFDPMQLDLGVKGCTAALYNMCVEPDGAVLPCQSYYQPLGNLLEDDWDSIWNHELAVYLRERRYIPEKCSGCSLLSECGGGCPLSLL
ncbi:MAG: radical SAM protein [Chloroflexi bacterium]|mgnify:CR=1 FL=1|jgi:radical SAM protein with 4Fe4S-binding SPASM domain|nr:radical SAM protein [Chloroflexota bacterium]